MQVRHGSRVVLAASMLTAGLVLVVLAAGGPARAQEPGQDAPSAAPAPETPPAPDAGKAPEAAPAPAPGTPEEEPLPRIIRVVCTDHICGHCDGKCHKNSGHVAVDKKGHCACTPTEGSALDRATRDAYEKHQPQ